MLRGLVLSLLLATVLLSAQSELPAAAAGRSASALTLLRGELYSNSSGRFQGSGFPVYSRGDWFRVRFSYPGAADQVGLDLTVPNRSRPLRLECSVAPATAPACTGSPGLALLAAATGQVEFVVRLDARAPVGWYGLAAWAGRSRPDGTTRLQRHTLGDQAFAVVFNPFPGSGDVAAEVTDPRILDDHVASDLAYTWIDRVLGTSDAPEIWSLRPGDPQVLRPVLTAVHGAVTPVQAAIRLRRWVSTRLGPWRSEFSSAVATWDVPTILAAGDPAGQCFVFSATLVAAQRAIGLPGRLVTAADARIPWSRRPAGATRTWNFHVWAEVWYNGAWHASEPTSYDQLSLTQLAGRNVAPREGAMRQAEGFGPVARDQFLAGWNGGSRGALGSFRVYVWDPEVDNTLLDVTAAYLPGRRPPVSPSEQPLGQAS